MERQKAGWTFWFAVALLLPALYCVALGPAAWFSARFGGARAVSLAYRPLIWTAQIIDVDGNWPSLKDAICRYSKIGSPNDWTWIFGNEPGKAFWFELNLDFPPMFIESGLIVDESSIGADESEEPAEDEADAPTDS